MNNFSPLLFRKDGSPLFLKNAFGKDYCPLAAPMGYLPSFLINLRDFGLTGTGGITWETGGHTGELLLISVATGTQYRVEAGLHTAQTEGLVFYEGIYVPVVSGTVIPNGLYQIYVQFKQNNQQVTLRSETFMLVDTTNYIEVDYYNSFDLLDPSVRLPFSNGWRPRIFILSTGIGRPSYEYEEEAISRGGYTYLQQQISKKSYRFKFYAPEFLCDAMRIIRLCDNVLVKWAGENYPCDDFNMQIANWLAGEEFADVEISFSSGAVVVNVGNYIVSNGGGNI